MGHWSQAAAEDSAEGRGGGTVVSTILAMLGALGAGAADPPTVALEVEPTRGPQCGDRTAWPRSRSTGRSADGKPTDLTASAKYNSANPAVATVDPDGLIRPRGDGATTIEVSAGGRTATGRGGGGRLRQRPPVHFVGEVVPILTKLGCNAGGCHGKASGQNGFRLSLLGFDPRSDYEQPGPRGPGPPRLPRRARGEPAAQEADGARSPTAAAGGSRVGSPEYRTIARWIGQGMPFESGKEPTLVAARGRARPARSRAREGQAAAPRDRPLRDGPRPTSPAWRSTSRTPPTWPTVDDRAWSRRSTAWARRRSWPGSAARSRSPAPRSRCGGEPPAWDDAAVAQPDRPAGLRQAPRAGPRPRARPAPTPSSPAGRRSTSAASCRRPRRSSRSRRAPTPTSGRRWVDRLLERPEYADLFAMKWSAILRNKRSFGPLSQPGTFAFHAWIRQALAENLPYDRFVGRDPDRAGATPRRQPAGRLVSPGQDARGAGRRHRAALPRHAAPVRPLPPPPVRDVEPGRLLRLRRVLQPGSARKPGPDPITPRIFVLARRPGRPNPTDRRGLRRRSRSAAPSWPTSAPTTTRGEPLADWLRRPDNPFFARALVNRYWKHFFGRGLVEPEDDMRVDQPPRTPSCSTPWPTTSSSTATT